MRHFKTLLIAVALTAAIPATSHAAVTVGSNLNADGMDNLPGYCPNAGTCTGTNVSLPAANTAADGLTSPIDGVVVKYAVKSGSAGNPLKLQILRQSGTGFTQVATGAAGETAAGIAEFPAQTSIAAGDSIGLEIGNAALVWAITPGATAFAQGTTHANRELLVQATVEPDVDKDGLGDETQDADVQPPKDVTAPVISKGKAKRKKVTFRLSEAATVTLKVKRNGKVKTFTHAGTAGKNTFSRRFAKRYRVTLTATDAAGNVSQRVKLRFKKR